MAHKAKRNNYLVSIVIPSYLRFDLLQQCLDAIPAGMGEVPYEVILVENGSPKEQQREFLATAKLPPNTRVVMLTRNVGYPGACNRGFKEATAPLVMVLTNDVILEPGSGERLVMNMDDSHIGLVGMKLLFPSEQEIAGAGLNPQIRPARKIQHVGLFTTLRAQIIHMYIGWSADNHRVNAVREVYAVTGAVFMTRRVILNRTGGFDERYGAGTYEDVDLAMQVRDLGYQVVVDTQAVATHYVGATAEKFRLAFPTNENEIKFKQKWYNKLTWNEYLAW